MTTFRSITLRRRRAQSGSLTAEMLVAIGLLALTLLPLSVSFVRDYATARSLYFRAVAIAIVDGEMEVLRAGEWRAYPSGTHGYTCHADAMTNLPPGRFVLTREELRLRLEWLPATRGGGGRVMREFEFGLPLSNAPTNHAAPPPPAPTPAEVVP